MSIEVIDPVKVARRRLAIGSDGTAMQNERLALARVVVSAAGYVEAVDGNEHDAPSALYDALVESLRPK
jgi:hypothetical protein